VAGRATVFIIAFVDNGTRQPGAQGAAMKCAQTAKGGDERVLHGISGTIFVSDGTQGDVEERILMEQDDFIEGI
jgi:hypothetical protein